MLSGNRLDVDGLSGACIGSEKAGQQLEAITTLCKAFLQFSQGFLALSPVN
jgi:hypothetical protein